MAASNYLLVFIVLLLGTALASTGRRQKRIVTKLNYDSETGLANSEARSVGIYKGNATTMNTHRYLVGILKNGDFQCSGSIVSESWVLTIGDCTEGLTESELTVVTGSSDGVSGKTYQVTQITTHPDYVKNSLDYEFSCIQVEGKFYYWAKRSHLLPITEPDQYMSLTVAGYGYTTSSATQRALRKAEMIYLTRTECETYYKDYKVTWTDRMACAYNPNQATLCSGDFGDTFVVGDVLYGQFIAVSKSGFCTDSALPVILSDVFQVADWIQDITGARYA